MPQRPAKVALTRRTINHRSHATHTGLVAAHPRVLEDHQQAQHVVQAVNSAGPRGARGDAVSRIIVRAPCSKVRKRMWLYQSVSGAG
jgi:hypothetical protein